MTKYLALLLSFSTALSAQVLDYTLKGHMGATLEDGFTEGDAFTVTFKLDYSSVDSLPGFSDGLFMNAVSDLRFSLDSGSTGNYAGNMTGSHFLQTADDVFGTGIDYLFFYASPLHAIPNFPDVGTHTLNEFGLDFAAMTGAFQSTSELGQSLGSLLNNSLDLALFDVHALHFTFDDYQTYIPGTIESISVGRVPDEMSVGLWSALSLLGVLSARYFGSLTQRLGGTKTN